MSCRVVLPGVLRTAAGGRREVEAEGATLGAVLDDLAMRLPLLERRLRDERGVVRQHVLLFIDGVAVRGEGELDAPVPDGAEVYVSPAVSGG